jgi:hypothetical protein
MVGDFVAKDHLARFVLSLVRDDLGLEEITGTYGSERGQRRRFKVQSTAPAAPRVAQGEGRLGRMEFRSLADEPIVLHGTSGAVFAAEPHAHDAAVLSACWTQNAAG